MSAIKPYVIAHWIADEIKDEEYVPLLTAIEDVIRIHISAWSNEQISETSEKIEDAVFEELGKISDQFIDEGIEPSFNLDGSPGTAFIKGENLQTVKSLTIIRGKDPTAFEQLCVDILSNLGGNTRRVGGSGDGGIDFIATEIPIFKLNSPALRASLPIVIGQAKRYKEDNIVSVNDVRNFIGGALIKADELKRENNRYGLFSPVIFAFWTTSNFTKDAVEFSQKSGIWYLSGLAVAQLALKFNLIKE